MRSPVSRSYTLLSCLARFDHAHPPSAFRAVVHRSAACRDRCGRGAQATAAAGAVHAACRVPASRIQSRFPRTISRRPFASFLISSGYIGSPVCAASSNPRASASTAGATTRRFCLRCFAFIRRPFYSASPSAISLLHPHALAPPVHTPIQSCAFVLDSASRWPRTSSDSRPCLVHPHTMG